MCGKAAAAGASELTDEEQETERDLRAEECEDGDFWHVWNYKAAADVSSAAGP